MRKILLFVAVLAPLTMQSQSSLEIHDVKGDVQLKRAGKKDFQKAKKLDDLDWDDVIFICKDCGLTITNVAKGNRYVVNQFGKWTVRQLIEQKRKAESNSFSNRLKNVLKAQKVGQYYKGVNFVDKGATIRGAGVKGDGNDEQTIYDTIYSMLLQGGQKAEKTQDIMIRKIDNQDGSFSIAVTNTGSRVLFCNVLIASEQWFPAVCYYTDVFLDMIPLLPNEEIDFSDMPLESSAGDYFLLVTEENIDIRHLDTIFRENPKIEGCISPKIKMISL